MFFLVVGAVFYHEAGHYIIAFYNGWEPKFGLKENGIFSAFSVDGKMIFANTPDEINYVLNTALVFSAAGSFGVLPCILFGFISGDYALSFGLTSYLLIYSIWEIVNTFKLGILKINEEDTVCF
jgi:hypothetical protein